MAKTFDELMKQYGHTKIGEADMALGRNNPGALETILQERQRWANATTQEEENGGAQQGGQHENCLWQI